jgi:hypothetical protein
MAGIRKTASVKISNHTAFFRIVSCNRPLPLAWFSLVVASLKVLIQPNRIVRHHSPASCWRTWWPHSWLVPIITGTRLAKSGFMQLENIVGEQLPVNGRREHFLVGSCQSCTAINTSLAAIKGIERHVL